MGERFGGEELMDGNVLKRLEGHPTAGGPREKGKADWLYERISRE